MRMTKQRALAAAVALTLSSAGHTVYAGDVQTQKDGYETAPVVVTASGFEEDVRYAPASISVITAVFEMWRTLKAKLKKEARRNRQKNL